MSDLEDFKGRLVNEIATAKKQHQIYGITSAALAAVVIVSGGLATFFAAAPDAIPDALAETPEADKYVTAALAFCTTVSGMFEKSFGLSKKALGYREAKTRFQNLEIDVLQVSGKTITPELANQFKEIRILKTDLTKS
ncbi:MAG: hypothetical protein AAF423_09270 [Pseudomonadota bacterium]